MSMILDMLRKPINIGDYVVFTNNIYEVKGLGKAHPSTGNGSVKILLINPSPSTRPVTKYSGDMVVIPKGDVLFKILKQ
jgi:hypothetical protein